MYPVLVSFIVFILEFARFKAVSIFQLQNLLSFVNACNFKISELFRHLIP